MKWLTMIVVVLLFVSAAPAQAQQDLSPPPPPPEVETEVETEVQTEVQTEVENERDPEASQSAPGTPADDAESAEADAPLQVPLLSISSPIGGSQIGVATVVEGTATPRASVELYIDGTLEQRMKADKSGRYRATVSGLVPNTRTLIEVRELDAQGEVLSTSSIVARVVEVPASPAVPTPAVVERPAPATEPGPARDPVISDDSSQESTSGQPIEAPVGQVTRGLISTAAGFVGGPVGGGIGLLLGYGVGYALVGDDFFGALVFALMGAVGGYAAAMPLSVYLAGYLLDGDGDVVLTALACYAGLGLAIITVGGLGAAIDPDGEPSTALLLGVLLAGPAAGALIFELTSNPSRRAAKQGISMTPLVAPTSDGRGAIIGLGGSW